MICQACGAESAPGKFCSNCGAELPVADYEQPVDDVNEYEQPVQDAGSYEQQDLGAEQYEQPMQETDNFDQAPYQEDVASDQTYEEPPADPADDLFAEGETETAATDDLFADGGGGEAATDVQDNEIVDKTKEAASNFGSFFVNYLKEPMKAINVTKDQLISSIITMAIFSLIISLNLYFSYRKIASFLDQGAFVDGFLLPLVNVIILFAVAIAITFAGISLTHQSNSFMDTIAKFGAFAVPFSVFYFLAFIISFMGLTRVFLIVALTSIIGVIIVVPAILILNKPTKRFDSVFVMLGVTLVNLIALSSIISAFINNLIGGMFGGIMGGF